MTEQTPQTDDAAPQDHGRPCRHCQAPMAADQDWCLACGHASSGRLGRLPGMRAAGTVAALTLALSGGAVAAAYAALSEDPPPPAATQVAQAPPTTAPPAASTAPAAPAPVTPPTADSTPALPSVPDDDGGGHDDDLPSLPELPDLSSDVPVTPTSPKSSGSLSKPRSSSGSKGKTTDAGQTTGSETTQTTGTTTTPAPKKIELDASAAQLYDPFTRAEVAGETADLFDGKPSTHWSVSVPAGAPFMNVGLAFDLGTKRGIREIDLATTTPGFKIEIYAADAEELPPTVLDTRWAHLKDVGDIGTKTDDNSESITIGRGTSKYRYLMLWFKQPPKPGPTITLSSLKLLG